MTTYEAGELEETRRLCLAALKLEPKDFEATQLLAFAQYRLGELQEALATCERMVGIRPDHAEAHNSRGGRAVRSQALQGSTGKL